MDDRSPSASNELEPLNSLVNLLENPEDLLQTLLSSQPQDDDKNAAKDIQATLRSTSKSLFSTLEHLASLQQTLSSHSGEEAQDDESPLSGLSQLLVGSSPDSGNNSDTDDEVDESIDAETIWGQVDLQNAALIDNLSENLVYLKKKIKNGQEHKQDLGSIVRLLNDMDSDSEEDNDIMEEGEEDDSDSIPDDDGSKDISDDDSEARRIRERMEKAMADMDDDSADNDDEEESIDYSKATSVTQAIDDDFSEEDPIREQMNDGFFDLNEMQAFADEEEEMLPDGAFDERNDDEVDLYKKKQKQLPHVLARKGNVLEDFDEDDFDEEDEDEEDAALSKPNEGRKRYRDDDDINALEAIYKGLGNKGEGVANMTASDFFGPPRKPSERYLQLKKNQITKVDGGGGDDDDADSWDDHDFASEGKDWTEGEEVNQETSENDDDEGKDDTENGETETSDEKIEKLSNFASHSQKLQQMTKKFEEEMLAEKPWQMLGEAKGSQRPADSLLEATPLFEGASKSAPIITVEHTESLEEMIKARILAEDWDDVIPRELPDIGMKKDGELPEVSQEKSKLSLGELYEREYLKKATGYDKDAEEKLTEEEKAKGELKSIFAKLCSKLDALSNYHFAPRPVCDEVDVKTSTTPAIAMEEVLPLHVSDAKALAPEEIYASKKGRDAVIRGESEKSQLDRQRERQSKKAARRKARKSKLADEKLISKLQPGLGLNNPYEKRKMREELQMARASGKVIAGDIDQGSSIKTSTGFFEKLNQESVDGFEEANRAAKRRKKEIGNASKAVSFKL